MYDKVCDMDCCPPEQAGPLPQLTTDAGQADLALLAKALSHPARVRILRLLLARDACVCGEIVAHLPLAQATVSQHLKVLRESGLIKGEVDGPRVCYCVDRSRLTALGALVEQLCDARVEQPLEAMK